MLTKNTFIKIIRRVNYKNIKPIYNLNYIPKSSFSANKTNNNINDDSKLNTNSESNKQTIEKGNETSELNSNQAQDKNISEDSIKSKITKKYSDNYQLSQEEINSILKKPLKKPNILHETQVEQLDLKRSYEKSVQDKIGDARYNTIQHLHHHLEISSKDPIDINILTPSDRPDVKYYKYNLPIPNIDPQIEGLEDVFERERAKRVTPNQKIWELLKLDEESDYKRYELALKDKYNNGKYA